MSGQTVETVGDPAAVAQPDEGRQRVAESFTCCRTVSAPARRFGEDLQRAGVVERPLLEPGERDACMQLGRVGVGAPQSELGETERCPRAAAGRRALVRVGSRPIEVALVEGNLGQVGQGRDAPVRPLQVAVVAAELLLQLESTVELADETGDLAAAGQCLRQRT